MTHWEAKCRAYWQAAMTMRQPGRAPAPSRTTVVLALYKLAHDEGAGRIRQLAGGCLVSAGVDVSGIEVFAPRPPAPNGEAG